KPHAPAMAAAEHRLWHLSLQRSTPIISRKHSLGNFTLVLSKHMELRRVARGLGKAEMAERVRGEEPPTRRALEEPALDQERLDDVLDRVARLGERGCERLDTDRSPAVGHRERQIRRA